MIRAVVIQTRVIAIHLYQSRPPVSCCPTPFRDRRTRPIDRGRSGETQVPRVSRGHRLKSKLACRRLQPEDDVLMPPFSPDSGGGGKRERWRWYWRCDSNSPSYPLRDIQWQSPSSRELPPVTIRHDQSILIARRTSSAATWHVGTLEITPELIRSRIFYLGHCSDLQCQIYLRARASATKIFNVLYFQDSFFSKKKILAHVYPLYSSSSNSKVVPLRVTIYTIH